MKPNPIYTDVPLVHGGQGRRGSDLNESCCVFEGLAIACVLGGAILCALAALLS